jgi:phospholipid/cholesterol/gamma-HCH transport system substrate-binding protein
MTRTRLAVVGLFVLCGAALAMFTIVSFGAVHPFRHETSAEIVFDGPVSGLAVGAAVTFRGVPVGHVTAIRIEYDPKTRRAYIPVLIELQDDTVKFSGDRRGARLSIAAWVGGGLKARLLPTSLISGETEVDLDFDTSDPPRLHPDIADLPEIPAAGLGGGPLAEQLGDLPLRQLATNANLALRSMRQLADSLNGSLPPLLDSATRSSTMAGQAFDAARVSLTQLQRRTDVTLSGIDRLTATGQSQLDGRGAELHTLLVSSNEAVLEARDTLGNMESLTEAQSPARTNLEETLRDLSDASASLRGFAADVDQNPRLLLTGRRR